MFSVPHQNLELSNEYGLTLFRISHALPFKTNKIVFIKSVKIMFTIEFIAIACQLNWEKGSFVKYVTRKGGGKSSVTVLS